MPSFPTMTFTQECGVDIVGKDNKTIIHHKAAFKFFETEVQATACTEQHSKHNLLTLALPPTISGVLGPASGREPGQARPK